MQLRCNCFVFGRRVLGVCKPLVLTHHSCFIIATDRTESNQITLYQWLRP